jgi:hypothetical protein
VILDLGILQHHRSLQSHSIANDAVGANCHIWTDAAVLPDLRGWVNQDVSAVDVGKVGGGQHLGFVFCEGREVEAGSGKEILGLPDIHPEPFEIEGVELAVLADCGESLLLDGCGAELDALEDAGVQDVDTGVDAIAHELDGFLDEAVNATGVIGLVDYDTIFGRFFDFGDDDCALLPVGLVEFGELLEGVFADDVGVEDEEGGVVFA